jgi:hypothetical protein
MNTEYLQCIIYNLNILVIKWLSNHLILELFKNLKTKKVKHKKSFGFTI